MTTPRYYVDFYDLLEGWGTWGFMPERLFASLEEARALRDQLNADLAEDNKAAGEHWGIIDRAVSNEIECVRKAVA